jgi:hypothetical protein
MGGVYSTNVEKRDVSKLLVGRPTAKRPSGRQRRRWMDNIVMEVRAIEWDGVDSISLAQDTDKWRAVVNAAMNFQAT